MVKVASDVDTGDVTLGRGFWFLWFASIVSSTGDGMALVAFPLLARLLTSDPRAIGALFACQRLPWLLLALPVGALADRRDSRSVMCAADIARAAVVGLVAFAVVSEGVTFALLCVAAFLMGTAETGFSAAAQAAIPRLVDRQSLPRANGLIFAAQMSGEQMIGPALGSFLFVVAAALPFLLDGVSFLASACLLAAVPWVYSRPIARHDGPGLREAIRWYRADSVIRLSTRFVAVAAFCQTMVASMLIIYVLDVLELQKQSFGLLIASLAVGNVAGGLLAHRILRHLAPASALLGGALLMALSFAVVGLFPSLVIAIVFLQLESMAIAVMNVQNRALRQMHIPRDMIGKLTNLVRMVILGVAPFGAITAGVITQQLGTQATFVAAAAILAVAVLMARRPLSVALG